MKEHLILGVLLISGATLTTTTQVKAQGIEVASESNLGAFSLPEGSMRFTPSNVPKEITDVLQAMVPKGSRRGETEVLGWAGNGYDILRAGKYKANLSDALNRAGWKYEEGEKLQGTQGSTRILVTRNSPTIRKIIGFWAPTDSALILAWAEIVPVRAAGNAKTVMPPVARPAKHNFQTLTPNQVSVNPAQVTVIPGGSGRKIINVSKGQKPKAVTFAALTPKAGFVRGYVKNGSGKPLAGAIIGVRSSATGGFYSGANGKTDARGYYEIRVPWGAAEFYNAGYTTEFYEGRAAFGLYPADGEASSFASANGLVENWVLPSFGIANADDVFDQPQYFGNYYGGSFSVSYFASDPRFGNDGGLPQGAEIDLTLIPAGPLLDGTKGRNYVFKQRVEDGIALGFTIVNIPVGQYRIVALLRNNRRTSPLKIEESGPNASKPFGLEPKKATETAILTFRPSSATADKVAPGKSNWAPLAITLKP